MRARLIVLGAMMISWPLESLGYTITVYPQSAYNTDVVTMDATLGLSASFLFEDFDDTVLIPQLQVSGTAAIVNQPPVPVAIGSIELRPEIGIGWTSNTALKVAGNVSPVRFDVVGGVATLFGVGFGEDQGAAAVVQINGSSTPVRLSTLPNYHPSVGNPAAFIRNGYVEIEPEAGDAAIQFVDFFNGGGDRIWLDHVAIQFVAVPEPISVLLMLLAAALCATIGRRR